MKIEFKNTNDVFNWSVNDNSTIMQNGDFLTLSPLSITTVFKRPLIKLNPNKNTLKIGFLFNTRGDGAGSYGMSTLVKIFTSNGDVLFKENVSIDEISGDDRIDVFVERSIKYDIESEQETFISVSIKDDSNSTINASRLECENTTTSIKKIKTYFSFRNLFDDAQNCMSGAVILKKWKTDNKENINNFFNAETIPHKSKPIHDWKFSKNDITGETSELNKSKPNSFNPFYNELGLKFSKTPFFGDSIGSISGSDYGNINIGVDKPFIYNGNLIPLSGAFYIYIDYSKDFEAEFDVVVNDSYYHLYKSPTYVRTFHIKWDCKKCVYEFYYFEGNNRFNVLEDGFLTGITPPFTEDKSIPCSESFNPKGSEGSFEYEIDFGTTIGQTGIDYNAFGVPDRFQLTYDGVTYDTGFVGSSSNNKMLIDAGISPDLIKTGNPSTGAGKLVFNKRNAYPRKAILKITGTEGTGWNVKGRCPKLPFIND